MNENNFIPSDYLLRDAIEGFERANANGRDHHTARQDLEATITIRIMQGRVNYARRDAIEVALHRDATLTRDELLALIEAMDEREAERTAA